MENAILWGWLENNSTNQINAQIASFSSPQPPSLERQLGSFEKGLLKKKKLTFDSNGYVAT